MFGNRRGKSAAVLTGFALALLLSAGVVGAAQFRGLESPETFESAIRDAEMTEVAAIPAMEGKAKRGVFVQKTRTGLLCLVDAPTTDALTGQGGCNRADDPFAGRHLFVSFAYDGGPAVNEVKDARLVGLASLEAASVDIVMSDGTRRETRLREASVGDETYRAFGYRFKKADLRRGVSPTAVIARDEAGQEIDRQATGYAG